MSAKQNNLPLVLAILDGWGIAPPSRGNAITEAHVPFYSELLKNYQVFSLAASGEAVGLPWGEPGNSEVGHLNLGAGKIVYQDVLRINQAIETGSFFEEEVLLGSISHCKKHNSSFHIIGILSEGGVHGHQDHIYAALELAKRAGLKRVFVHVILDGRDVAYDSGEKYLKQLEKVIKRLGVGCIATISGRFYAMDRDNQWDRIEKAYRAMVRAESKESFASPMEALKASYANKVYDEECVPVVIAQEKNKGSSRIQAGDSVLFTNYRPDRARELTKAFVLPAFDKFQRTLLSNFYFATMSEYDPDLPAHVVFRKEPVEYPLGRVLSESNLSQLHIGETEKYAHVTYFFNGGKDIVFPRQENIIIPSSGVASYADAPEMGTQEITKRVLSALSTKTHDVIIMNFANADMVGHTGNLAATIRGLSIIDTALAAIFKEVDKRDGIMIVTSDHGNAEEMVNWENGHIAKEHSTNPVPCIFASKMFKRELPRQKEIMLHELQISGVLSDVAPTILAFLGIQKPESMSSRPLI
ncbi:phosphoglycerate mutase (2,3-diphosphoglycerate-independent) [bacterium CG10_46_32]|nr:MAG: phosphoglycerate mutase (2,3-diphosphoglycerate-independent) [bacterium CG10_46_32]PIR55677.1 MAG: 2,3-bisphosphoglycerate-independent phosphoglycerate mutase [Parcubacteria group bacterium CG10_big_fil_rev_8_21_14_0_10_46_32]